jgi:hypothetical protein
MITLPLELLFSILNFVCDDWPSLAQVHRQWNPKKWLKAIFRSIVIEKVPSLKDFEALRTITLHFGNQRAQFIEVSDHMQHLYISSSNNCCLRANKLQSLTLLKVPFVQSFLGAFLDRITFIGVDYPVLDFIEELFPHLNTIHIVDAKNLLHLNISKKVKNLILKSCPVLSEIEPSHLPLLTYLSLSALPKLQSIQSVPNLREFSWDQKVSKPLFDPEKLASVSVDVKETLERCCEIPTKSLCLVSYPFERLPEIEWSRSIRSVNLQQFLYLVEIPKIPSWVEVLHINRCGLRNSPKNSLDILEHCDIMLKRGLRLVVEHSAYFLVEPLLGIFWSNLC